MAFQGKRTFEVAFGDDGVSDHELVQLGETLDTEPSFGDDGIQDDELVQLGEDLEPSVIPENTQDSIEPSVQPESLGNPQVSMPMDSVERPDQSQEDTRHEASQTDQVGGGPLLEFDFQPASRRRNWKNVLSRQRFTANLHLNRDATAQDNVGEAVTDALRRAIQRHISADPTLTPHSTVHFAMQSTAFSHAFQSTTFTVGEFMTEGNERLDVYLQSLAEKLNSNEEFEADDTFNVDLTFIRTPGPGRGHGKRFKPSAAAVRGIVKKSRVLIHNKDALCCARAIVTMQAHLDGGEDSRNSHYDSVRRGKPVQTRLARELHRLAGVPEGPCGIEELKQFQAVLPNYQLKVLSIDPPHMVVYQGPTQPSHSIIRLILEDGHYDGCTSFKGFVNTSYYCDACNKGYDHDDYTHHPCEGVWCPSCKGKNCPDRVVGTSPSLPCDTCHRTFFGPTCLAAHKQGKRSTCQTLKKCLACRKKWENTSKGKTPKKHRCFHHTCPICDKVVDGTTHRCFIQRLAPDEDAPKWKRVPLNEVQGRAFQHPDASDKDRRVWVEREPPLKVYADYEAITDDEGVQTPVLVCAESEEEDVTHHFNHTEEFFQWLESLATDVDGDDRQVIILFHNLKGYDGMFLLQYCYDSHREVKNQITVGTKILSFVSDLFTFKDSLCFLPFPLANFPATFGIQELKKGFFPHKFNTAANQDYVGPLLLPEFYDPDGMSVTKKKEFETWYAQEAARQQPFDMKAEMLSYCESDVKLLRAGCQKFVAEFKGQADFDPLVKCVTIASACNRFWRKKQVPKDLIASKPPRGWGGARTNQSHAALQWLAWQEQQLRTAHPDIPHDLIQSVRNGGEQRVATFLVDGYIDKHPTTGKPTVYEFHGCLWHGCPTCFPTNRGAHPIAQADRNLHELYEATLHKEQQLRQQGYEVVVVWECEWSRLLKTHEDVKAFVDHLDLVDPLEPRDAFFGGRTNAVKLHHHVAEGEKIEYIDVTSLYPYINKNYTYPTGHPTVIVNPENQDIHQYFGMAKVDILPPANLYHPVLPYRLKIGAASKLTFPLCRSCVLDETSKPMLERSPLCSHTDDERTLRGTWCTPEIVKAVEMGYTIVKIHEVYHFPEHQRHKGLFGDYVDTWLKTKQESAGYPRWCQTDAQKNQYVADYKEREGIQLDPALIQKNPGRKTTAKLMLNSFWGKFGENLWKSSTVAVHTAHELFNVVADPLTTIQQVRVVNADTVEIVHKNVTQNQEDNGRVNIFVAAFTTCGARLKLYSYLERLQTRVLYFDTDSVIYLTKPGESSIELGDYLGDMTDELEGDFIIDFTSAGPKNYGYRTAGGKVCIKVRGFSLNFRGLQQLNYSVMRDNLLEELTNPLEERRNVAVHNPNFFWRHPATKTIKIISRTKQYGLVFDKRVVDPETFCSYPYGYERV